MSDVDGLFGDLEQVLANWDSGVPHNAGQLPENPEHSGVTDEQLEAAIQQAMARGQRVGPSPAVSGQQVPVSPQFQAGASAPPPPDSYVEDTNGNGAGRQETIAPPGTQASPDSGEGQVVSPVSEPSAEALDEEFTLGVNESNEPIRVPRSKLLAYYGFEQELQSDPQLRTFLQQYLATGQLPTQPSGVVGDGSAATVQPPSSTEPSSRVPDGLPQEVLEDPALRAIWEAQQNQIAQLTNQIENLSGGLQTTIQQQQVRQQAENTAIINRATASFKQQHNLSDDDMNTLRQTAANLNVLQSLMSGMDPITGAPSKPDPLSAVERALEIAMYSIPEYRSRAMRSSLQRRVEDSRRRQKIGALAGSSGSVPRTTQAPTTAEGRRQAMIRELAEMQAGTWSEQE